MNAEHFSAHHQSNIFKSERGNLSAKTLFLDVKSEEGKFVALKATIIIVKTDT
jgi:hypothetical protein